MIQVGRTFCPPVSWSRVSLALAVAVYSVPVDIGSADIDIDVDGVGVNLWVFQVVRCPTPAPYRLLQRVVDEMIDTGWMTRLICFLNH